MYDIIHTSYNYAYSGLVFFFIQAVETVMRIHLEEPPGDILVFLTGQEEIEYACDKLFENAEKVDYRHDVHYNEVEAMLILPLYGSLMTGRCLKEGKK